MNTNTEPSDPEIDTVAKARVAERPPFPRVAVATTQSIIDHLKTVEEKLQEVLVALGLAHSPRQ